MNSEEYKNYTDNPEVLAIAPLPSAVERRRREAVLARLLVTTLEMLLSEGHTDMAVKIETAKDMIREFKHVYPETMNVRQPPCCRLWQTKSEAEYRNRYCSTGSPINHGPDVRFAIPRLCREMTCLCHR